MVRLRRKLCS
jgi:hypothetical protein